MVSRVAELTGAIVIILIGFTTVCALTNDPADRSRFERGPVQHSSFGFVGAALEDGDTARLALAQFPLPLPERDESESSTVLIAAIQRELALRGFDPGPADGLRHPATVEAIRAYQGEFGLDVTGAPSQLLLDHLTMTRSIGQAVAAPDGMARKELVLRVQRRLMELGYWPGEINGILTERTREAIGEFERENAMTVTGDLSHNLVMRLGPKALGRFDD